MLGYRLLLLASLITFTFGALTFSVLTLFYWREKKPRRQAGAGPVFRAFTVACASAFLINLMLRIIGALDAESRWAVGLSLALVLVAGLMPALLFHLVYAEEEQGLRRRNAWQWLLRTFYTLSIVAALAQGLNDSELAATPLGDQLDNAPALFLGSAGALGLLLQMFSRRQLNLVERRHRLWMRVLLVLTLLCALANLAQPGPFVSLLPDYVVLAFFCVTLYYKERLMFFDLLIKRGAFFAAVLIGLTLAFLLGPAISERLPVDWSRPWISGLLLTPLVLAGPWIYSRLAEAIDRRWLRRRYPPAEAERQFVRDVQGTLTEQDLRARASESLSNIFQAPAHILFGPVIEQTIITDDGLVAGLEHDGTSLGRIVLKPRPDCIPFLSDDVRLLQSVARTLSVVLENVRFREQRQQQQEREQQLRWLASRAELKALRAQIDPHFLFNALNAIAGLIQDQPAQADETIEHLAHVFRYTLRRSENEWVRLKEEVDFVSAYLRVEQARFGDRLRVELDVSPAAGDISVPAMSVQPLIENAIKHGISVSEGRGQVILRAAIVADLLCIEVLDNGPGFPRGFSLAEPLDGHTSSGHGLRNIIERLKGYYGSAAQLDWENTENGARVILKMPKHATPDSPGKVE